MAELSMSKLSMSNTKEEPAAAVLGVPVQSPPMVLATAPTYDEVAAAASSLVFDEGFTMLKYFLG